MNKAMVSESAEFPGVNVIQFEVQLARGVMPFSNQNCAATMRIKKGSNIFAIRPAVALPQDGNALRSKFVGRTIKVLIEQNPRREGTKGFKSFNLILKAGGALSYDLYKLMGGRPNDLQWDLDHGFVELA